MPSIDVLTALDRSPSEVGPALLSLSEDQWFDRKGPDVSPQKLANLEVGMANADGGVIVVGLVGGRVEGTDRSPTRRNQLMQAAIDLTDPPVRTKSRLVPCRRADGTSDHLLVVEVVSGETVYANNRDEVYLRIGDETRRLSFAQRQELTFDKGYAKYEAQAVPDTIVEDLDADLLAEYARAVGHPDPVRLLAARGLTTGEQLTVAGLLSFGRTPQLHLPEAYVRVLRYRGEERGSGARQQVIADERCEGPIPTQLDRARELVGELQPTRRALTSSGRFGPVPLVPPDAWLEGLVNAAIHRSYSIAGDHVRVEIFDDRIEITSPGRFPGLADVSNPVEITRFARNPRIARVCFELRYGQKLGEGIRRMFEEMRLAGLVDPMYHQTAASVRLTLSAELVHRELDGKLRDDARVIMTALRDAGRLSTGEIGELIGVSRPVTISRLKELEKLGLISWVGKSASDPRAYWCLPNSGTSA